ncbi:MAG: 23S rRNA (uracil(1939)-C(5))-methyltransferase RlmD [Lachnospiraceae bacterium]
MKQEKQIRERKTLYKAGKQKDRQTKGKVGAKKAMNARRQDSSKQRKNSEQKKAVCPKKKLDGTMGNCELAHKCGGCTLQGVPYEKQLKQKQKQTQALLQKFCRVYPITGMEDPFHYRNKVHAVFGRLRNGTYISGVYEEGTHRIVNVDACQIEDEMADAIIRDIRGLLKSFKIRTYDEDTGYGLLRHVMVRRGFQSGEVMVVLVLASPILPSRNNFVKALLKLHPEITTIVINVNDRSTSMVLGDKEKAIYGKGYIEDTLCGTVFRISPKSFYQVNPVQTEHLYAKAIELANLTGKERVVDAYCGIGTISLIAAKQAKEVIGVELNPDAVRDAVRNAKRNQVKNVSFYTQDAGKFMVEMAEQGEKADVVFMDPPRSGSDEVFMASVLKLAPKRIVYISCNPETLARDLEYLTKHGYRAKEAHPFDQFPFTKHVECVVLLDKKDK